MTTFTYGPNSLTNNTFNGRRISDFVRAFGTQFGLNGGEAVQVSSNGAAFQNVDNNYTIVDGDRIQFSLATGQKGLAA